MLAHGAHSTTAGKPRPASPRRVPGVDRPSLACQPMTQPLTTMERSAPSPAAAPAALLRSPVFATALAAGLFLLIELLTPAGRLHLAVDESMYLSQVTPGEFARYMHVHRARGTSLLVAPIAWLVDDRML